MSMKLDKVSCYLIWKNSVQNNDTLLAAFHCVKYRNLTWFSGMEISPKLCGNCAFPQIFHTKKSGKILVFYAVFVTYNGTAFSVKTSIFDRHDWRLFGNRRFK